jgi:DMSO/TMAO reductase YedYZ molybdopterin-dependent catalytic subunit
MAVNASSVADRAKWYGRSGAIAALLALFLDLLWRVTLAPAGVSSIPESVVAAVARLTPTSFFGWATENFGSLAQNSLFAAVLVGVALVGYWAGQVAGALVDSGRFAAGFPGRLVPAAIVGLIFFLFIAGAVFPIAREGFFAAGSGYQVTLLAQAALFATIWSLSWAALSGASSSVVETPTTRVGSTDSVSRRSALRGAAAAGLTAGVAILGWRLAKAPEIGNAVAQEEAAAEIAARARIAEPTEPESIFAAQSSTPQPVEVGDDANPEAAFSELEADDKLTPVITSVADFYHVSKNISDPVVDGAAWALTIGGTVATPLRLTYDEVVARAKTRNITTLSCISNELNGDLAGTAEWTGLPLRELLEEAGINPATVDVVFRAADGYDDSIPFAQAMDPTTLLVTGMNGEPLPPDHGFPARLIAPPIYGMKNVKWIEQIEAVDIDYLGYWQTRGWSDPAPYQIWGRIDTPAAGEELPTGPALAAGVAAAGDRGILRVEISLDGGTTWADADLEPSINPNFTWVRWVFPFEATPGVTKMLMRATDGEGTVAPSEYLPPLPDGATGWPERTVRVA